MKVAFALVAFVIAAWWLGVALRMWPLGTYRPQYLRPTSLGNILGALAIAAVAASVGLVLLI